MRRALAFAAVLAAGCGAAWNPALDPEEHVRGEVHRLVAEPPGVLWPVLIRGLADEDLPVARADPARGTISTRTRRYTDAAHVRRLGEYADLGALRRAGLRGATEFEVSYHLLLAEAGDGGTGLRIRSVIVATDRSQGFLLAGVAQVIPRRLEVPSRGVLERDLFRRLSATLFTAEEMLYLLGDLGVD